MTYTKQQLSTWTDSQILESLTPKFDELKECWDGGSHPEVLYNDGVYCELIAGKMTDEEKKMWWDSYTEDEETDGYENFDELLEDKDFLGEDIGHWWFTQPENKDEAILFTFKWLLNYGGDNIDDVLIPFLTQGGK